MKGGTTLFVEQRKTIFSFNHLFFRRISQINEELMIQVGLPFVGNERDSHGDMPRTWGFA